MEKLLLKVSILGKDYTIATDEEREIVLKAADLLNNLTQNIVKKTSSLNEQKVIVLAALQLATDLIKQEGSSFDLRSKLSGLVQLIESALK